MDLSNDFDFAIIADNPFPQDDTSINLLFDVAWNDKASKLIINCREAPRRGNHNPEMSKIKSFTLQELKSVHSELSSIQPKIEAYFPNDFTFKTVEIEQSNDEWSWNFFRQTPTTIIKLEKELSDSTTEAIKFYLRAVTDICGGKLLFSVIFNEDSANYFEDQDTFITDQSVKKIDQCRCICITLLEYHEDKENLQTLTEDLYIKEDQALETYIDALCNHDLMVSLPLIEDSQNIRENIEKDLLNLQVTDTGSKKITELKMTIEKCMQQYYEKYTQILNCKLNLSIKQKEIYLKYITKMLEDKNKYQTIIFRECAGNRLSNLSKRFHKENEKIAQLRLDLHATKDIIVMRKLELIQCWKQGQDMVRVNVRHEDVSLIQLKHLDSLHMEISLIDDYYSYIKKTYKLLLDYSETQRLNLENTKHTVDDPLDIVMPSSRKCTDAIKTNEKASSRNIDYSWVIDQGNDSNSDFEDALDEDEFVDLKKQETQRNIIKEDCENKLREIANKRAELRNSKARLKVQYSKLIHKASKSSTDHLESLHLESIHPEMSKSYKKPEPGLSLTLEQRKEEGRRVRERIKQYQQRLNIIPENNGMSNAKPKKKVIGKSVIKPESGTTSENNPVVVLKPVHQTPTPPLPPSAPPPPPIPMSSSSTNQQLQNRCHPIINYKNQEILTNKSTNYLDELLIAFERKKSQKTKITTIDEDLLTRKMQQRSQLNDTISSLIDNRRQFFSSNSVEDSGDENY